MPTRWLVARQRPGIKENLTTILQRLSMIKLVLYNILEAKGGNDFVEMRRDKKYENIKVEDIILQIQNEDENGENNSLTDIIALDIEDNLDETVFKEDNVQLK